MARKRNTTNIRRLAIWVFCIALAFGAFLYPRMLFAKAELEKYQKAEICPDRKECRVLIDGIVIESKSVASSILLPRRRYISTSTQYLFSIAFSNSEYKDAIVLPDIPPFETKDGLDVYIPISSFEKEFAESYFPTGESVKAEIWKDKIVFLFATDSREKEIMVPTWDHPQIQFFFAERDMYGFLYGFGFFLLVLIPMIISWRSHANH